MANTTHNTSEAHAVRSSSAGIFDSVERRTLAAPNPSDPCLCLVCRCGRHHCTGISCRPLLETRTTYRDEFVERAPPPAPHSLVARDRWQTEARRHAVPTKADHDHFLTTSTVFYNLTRSDSERPEGSVARNRQTAPPDAIRAFRTSHDELYGSHWTKRSCKPTEHFVPSGAFTAHTTSQELLGQLQYSALPVRSTRHGALKKQFASGRVLGGDGPDGDDNDAGRFVESVAHAEQRAVRSASESMKVARPPLIRPRPQLLSLAHSTPARGAADEQRPTTSYSVFFGVPHPVAPGPARRLRSQGRPDVPLTPDSRDFVTSNAAAYTEVAVARSTRRARNIVRECEAAPLYAVAKPGHVDVDGHIHLRVLSPQRRGEKEQ